MLFEEAATYYERLEGTQSRLAMVEILCELFGKTEKKEMKPLIYMTQGAMGPPFAGIQLGIAEKLAEQAIAYASGFSREEVVASFHKTGDLGATAEEFRGKSRLRRIEERKYGVADVFQAMLKIAKTSGSGSQEDKIKQLVNLLAGSSPLSSRYIIRLALGTLRLGAGDATILEALSLYATGERTGKQTLENAYNICGDLGRIGEILANEGMGGIESVKVSLFSPVRPALAERLPTSEEILKRMHGRCAVEAKYDGLRAQVHIDRKNKKVEIFSRNLERLTEMFPEIAKAALSEVHAEEAILDGEAIAFNEATGEFRPFQETIQRKRKHDIEAKSIEMPLHLFAYDVMLVNGKDCLGMPMEERRRLLESLLSKNGLIRPSDRIIVNTPKELDVYFEKEVGDGLEGIVAKDLDAPYIAGARKFSWIKLKRSYKGELSDTIDLTIVGYYLGKGSRAEFEFGGLLAAVYNERRDVFETITKIGTGFTEEQMKSFKKLLSKSKVKNKPARVDSLMKPDFWVDPEYVVTVRADEITRSPMHTCGREEPGNNETGFALRFPRITSDGVREDKKPEDSTTTKEIMELYASQKKTKVTAQGE